MAKTNGTVVTVLHIFQTLEGSMLSGEVLISGGTNWDLVGRNQVPKGGMYIA